jgi:hypothetical protein
LSSRASWAIRSMGLLAFKVRLQHRATKDTTRPKRLFLGPRHENGLSTTFEPYGSTIPRFSENTQAVYLRFLFREIRHG